MDFKYINNNKSLGSDIQIACLGGLASGDYLAGVRAALTCQDEVQRLRKEFVASGHSDQEFKLIELTFSYLHLDSESRHTNFASRQPNFLLKEFEQLIESQLQREAEIPMKSQETWYGRIWDEVTSHFH